MKANFTQLKAILLIVLPTFCFATDYAQTKPVKILSGADTLISQNTTWDTDTLYFMDGKIYVTNGAELTIQPGTVITGDTTSKGALIITKGSKIHALGTASCPIVFTSSKAIGKRNRGDWGGVIILGKASTNQPGGIGNIEGLPPSTLTEYGGGTTPDDNDNSGELQYVRIEFPGVALSPNNEINGLTLGAVGRGTLIDYVQVSYGNDDSFEWFGGTVNAKHLIAFRGIDDDFDTDNGYSGNCQFGIGLRDPLIADVSGSNGFESDNDANSSSNLPQTNAIFSNFTLSAGSDSATNPNFRNGALVRRNSHLNLYNSIIMGYPAGINIDGTTTQANVTADTMVQNNIITCTYAPKYIVTTNPSNDTTIINLLQFNAANRFYYSNDSGPKLENPYNLNLPNLTPDTGSVALTGSSFNHPQLNDSFFVPTPYVGALSDDNDVDWTLSWANWEPTNADYSQVSTTCSVLPVNLLSFTAQHTNSDVTLNWTVAYEINMKGYELEKAENSNDFKTISFVSALNSLKNETYSITDKNAFTFAETVNYRLKQIDLNGSAHYSQILTIKNTSEISEITFPNPFRGRFQIQINFASSQTIAIRMHDMQGRLVASEKAVSYNAGISAISLNSTSNLAPGTYFLEIIKQSERSVYKVVKQ